MMALTAKQEAFCRGIVAGLSQSDAYRAAYPGQKASDKTVNEAACRLMANSKALARVRELRAPVMEELQYDLKAAMGEAKEAFDVAKAKENGGAMVAAATLRAKLNGLLVDRSEVRTGPLDGLEHDELRALNAAIAAIAKAGGNVAQSPSKSLG